MDIQSVVQCLWTFARVHSYQHACVCVCARACVRVCGFKRGKKSNFIVSSDAGWQWGNRNCNETDSTHFFTLSNTHTNTHTTHTTSYYPPHTLTEPHLPCSFHHSLLIFPPRRHSPLPFRSIVFLSPSLCPLTFLLLFHLLFNPLLHLHLLSLPPNLKFL